jgi:hypothetical protein
MQNQDLNRTRLTSRMPDDWDGVDPYARYTKVGIRKAERANSRPVIATSSCHNPEET